VRIKYLCWSVGMIYGPRGLLGVSTVRPGVTEVLQSKSFYLFIVSGNTKLKSIIFLTTTHHT
jgi:hypothetical protein